MYKSKENILDIEHQFFNIEEIVLRLFLSVRLMESFSQHQMPNAKHKMYQFSQSLNFYVFRINLRISIFHYLLVICIEFVPVCRYVTASEPTSFVRLREAECMQISVSLHFSHKYRLFVVYSIFVQESSAKKME